MRVPKVDAVSLLFLIIYYRKSVCDVVSLIVGARHKLYLDSHDAQVRFYFISPSACLVACSELCLLGAACSMLPVAM